MTSRAHTRFTVEFRKRAVQLVLTEEGLHSSRWAAVKALAPRIGCAKQTLDRWVRQANAPALTTKCRSDRDLLRRISLLEKENRNLKKANDILRKASAYMALAGLGSGPIDVNVAI